MIDIIVQHQLLIIIKDYDINQDPYLIDLQCIKVFLINLIHEKYYKYCVISCLPCGCSWLCDIKFKISSLRMRESLPVPCTSLSLTYNIRPLVMNINDYIYGLTLVEYFNRNLVYYEYIFIIS